MQTEKIDYYLNLDFPMYDMCHCGANCAQPCARKKASAERLYTISDFSAVCSRYIPEKEK